MTSLFGLPDEVILTPLFQSYPCREHQIRSLATLLHVRLLTVNVYIIRGIITDSPHSLMQLLVEIW
jgi:origin recognition complex subunit 5